MVLKNKNDKVKMFNQNIDRTILSNGHFAINILSDPVSNFHHSD